MEMVKMLVIPIIVMMIVLIALIKKIDIFSEFIKGVKFGVNTVYGIFPSLLGLIVAIGVFRESGVLDKILVLLKPIASIFDMPKEVLPLMLLRPISGSASLAMISDLMSTYGADSFIGRAASVIMASTDTIVYTLSIYLGCVGIKKIKYTLLTALVVQWYSMYIAIKCCRYFFAT